MEIILRAAAVAVVGCIFGLLLSKYAPELSLALVILTGAVILILTYEIGGKVVDMIWSVTEENGLPSAYVSPVLKCIGISLVTEMGTQICRDSGQASSASAVQLCGAVCALYVSLPVIESLIDVVERLQ